MSSDKKRRRHVYGRAARHLVSVLLADDHMTEERNNSWHASAEETAFMTASEVVLPLLAERIVRWRIDGIAPPPDEPEHYDDFAAAFASVHLSRAVLNNLLKSLRDGVDMIVVQHWPVVDAVAQMMLEAGHLPDDDVVTLVRSTLVRFDRSHAVSTAGLAVAHYLFGHNVDFLMLDPGETDVPLGVNGVVATNSPLKSTIADIHAQRAASLPHVYADPTYGHLATGVMRSVRRYDRELETVDAISRQFVRWQKAVNQFAGRVPANLVATVREFNDERAIATLAGEISAERTSGLVVPNRMGRLEVMLDYALIAEYPDDPATWLYAANEAATQLVDTAWPAILRVSEQLATIKFMDGKEFLRVVEALLPRNQLAA